MEKNDLVFLGVKGSVVALDRTTGHRVWERKLKGSDYVSLLVHGNCVLAGTQGEIFCLEATTGKPLWHDALKGYGVGLMSIATANASSAGSLARASQRQKSDSSSAAVAGVFAAS
jgi:outer membrane protein assembly factor BamB